MEQCTSYFDSGSARARIAAHPLSGGAADEAEVAALLATRAEARARSRFADADAARDALRARFSVFLDDVAKEWQVAPPQESHRGSHIRGAMGGEEYTRAGKEAPKAAGF